MMDVFDGPDDRVAAGVVGVLGDAHCGGLWGSRW